MSRSISLFSSYSQRENHVTNYCLLMLKMLYEENPKYLGEVLTALIGEDMADHVGVAFRQQARKKSSIPDGVIIQPGLVVYIETKNYEWFNDRQLQRHLAALNQESSGLKVLLALGRFEGDQRARFDRIQRLCRGKYRSKVVFAAASFEDLLQALRLEGLPKNLVDAVADLREFLDEEDLLGSWHTSLDVVNCARYFEEVVDHGVYMCPARDGAYSHRRCKYFGMYREKRVERVAVIEAVVDVDLAGETLLKWNNSGRPKSEFLSLARSKVKELRPDEGPTRVFLLGEPFETDFKKDSPGGMQASKRYFDISASAASNAQELADWLRGRRWSEVA
jgi:hypothetical protein